ncbi:hypothetical protein, partial [Tabrizicola sp.]|uniref:hypothetical protein n=1 Tax=Tabrizicola sp. TaxID=2005166 RepID=UPI0035B0AD61
MKPTKTRLDSGNIPLQRRFEKLPEVTMNIQELVQDDSAGRVHRLRLSRAGKPFADGSQRR